ncbi:hypothetical protein GCM10025734_55930 [Kitasatospora paranensis]
MPSSSRTEPARVAASKVNAVACMAASIASGPAPATVPAGAAAAGRAPPTARRAAGGARAPPGRTVSSTARAAAAPADRP